MATASERMREFDRERLRRRQARADQRYTSRAAERQAFQTAKLARRARAEEFRQMTAGVPAGTGLNTLQGRQQYVVGNQLPQGVARPERAPEIAAMARGQSLPQFEAVQRAARQQASEQALARYVAEGPERLQAMRGQQELRQIAVRGGVESQLAREQAGYVTEQQAAQQAALTGRAREDIAARERMAEAERASAQGISQRELAQARDVAALDRASEARLQAERLRSSERVAETRRPREMQATLDAIREEAVRRLGEGASPEDIQDEMDSIMEFMYGG